MIRRERKGSEGVGRDGKRKGGRERRQSSTLIFVQGPRVPSYARGSGQDRSFRLS